MTLRRTPWLVVVAAMLVALFGALALRGTAVAQGDVPTAAIPCENGMAGPYLCEGVDFLSFLSTAEVGGVEAGEKAANLWGWTDPDTDKKYVALGTTHRTAFIDVTDPVNPVYLGNLPTPTTPSLKYRDMKSYGNYLYIVSDENSQAGLQVFDMTRLRDVTSPPVTFTQDAFWDGLGNGHNLFINEESGFAYIARMTSPTLCNGAMLMVSLANPLAPEYSGCYEDGGFASDMYCVNYTGPDPDHQGQEICILASDNDILVANVSNKNNPQTLATLTYPDIMRAHLLWLTEDQRYGVSSDMNDEMMMGLNTRLFTWDFTDLDDPQLTGIYEGPSTASDHNVWIKGDRAYVGNFRAGLRIFDLAELPSGTLTEAAYFDMIPEDDNTGHMGGAWAAYVFFDDGLLAVSDKEAGLYLLEEQPSSPTAVTLDALALQQGGPNVAWLALVGMGTLLAVAAMRRLRD
ncbi:MAG: choice-of-anchor B family protein [Ardenticatenales bacterium]|nr:choice-of-anchor B family protein [Ardenticatenales bacterium]